MTEEEVLFYMLSRGEITPSEYLEAMDNENYRHRLKNFDKLCNEVQAKKEMSHSEFFKLVSDRSNIPIGTIKAVIDAIDNTYTSIKDEYKVTLPLIICLR